MEERVAAAVLEAYARLRVKDGGCWTVVAGVAAVAGDDVEVLSVASGCKCVGGPASPALVRDGHAEVLAMRALRRALCEDPSLHARLLAEDLWLYVTAPPCGDCAIFALDDGTVAFTGAKLGDWRREDDQLLGATRLKCGRSDTAPDRRSSSLSCSDKLCRWSARGLQGSVLKHVFPEPLALAAVVVARQPRASDASLEAALARSFRRCGALGAAPPRVALADAGADRAAARAGAAPSSLAVAWWRGAAKAEVLLAHRGVRRGATAAAARSGAAASALCSDALFAAAAAVAAAAAPAPPGFVAGDRLATKRNAPGRAADDAVASALRASLAGARKRPRSPSPAPACAVA